MVLHGLLRSRESGRQDRLPCRQAFEPYEWRRRGGSSVDDRGQEDVRRLPGGIEGLRGVKHSKPGTLQLRVRFLEVFGLETEEELETRRMRCEGDLRRPDREPEVRFSRLLRESGPEDTGSDGPVPWAGRARGVVADRRRRTGRSRRRGRSWPGGTRRTGAGSAGTSGRRAPSGASRTPDGGRASPDRNYPRSGPRRAGTPVVERESRGRFSELSRSC